MSVDHYENFPVASWLCPAHLRPPIRAIYWFARTADDLADEGSATPSERKTALRAYRQALADCADGQVNATPWAYVFNELKVQIQAFALPKSLLADLLTAFERDVDNPSYASHDELLGYCRYSAQPIGRLLLHLYGIDDPACLEASDNVCSALQLINFWQDLSLDLPRGRCYLPLDVLTSHGSHWRDWDPSQGRTSPLPAQRAVIEELVTRAVGLMHRGSTLVHALPGRAGWELRLVIQGGLEIARKIQDQDFDTLTRRPRLRAWNVPHLLARALTMSRA